jgi:hypothetical protein
MKELARTVLAKLVSVVPNGVLLDDRFFDLFQKKGLHILPVNFYQPVPDTRELPDRLWERPKALVGIDTKLPQQLAFLRAITDSYLREYLAIPDEPSDNPCEYTRASGFAGIDGAIHYAMVRKYKPRRIIEVGSGASSLLSLLALRRNAEESGHSAGAFTAIEPYPHPYLREALRGRGRLVEDKVENRSLAEFAALEANDILFIDSSHTVRIGGDVVYELLEILPRLQKGVLVHVHDIFLPQEYPKEWVLERYVFWNEQYLFQAFMTFNDAFETLWSAGCMHVHHSDELARRFPGYDPHVQGAGSYWIRRTK